MPTVGDQGERKLATLLFADLSGYTDMTRRLDPEDVASVIEPLMRELGRLAERLGGTVVMTAGDGLLCVFGVPETRDGDALRAVRAALQMRALADRTPGVSGLHAGIASGEVLVTPDDSHRGWGITGLCIALATRLCDKAETGQVLTDDETRRLVGGQASWGATVAGHLQGLGEGLVPMHLVDSSEPGPAEAAAIVDRLDERELLDGALQGVVREGSSAVVIVSGEPGIGKTALVEAWLEGRSDVAVRRAQLHPYDEERPLDPVLVALLHDEDGPHTEAELVELLAPWSDDRAAALAQRLHARLRSDPPAVSGSGGHEDTLVLLREAARALLRARSSAQPLVLVVEDLHWAGADVLEFLDQLRAEPVPAPVLVCATTRELPPGGLAETLGLGPLPGWAARDLVAQHLGRAPELVTSRLVERSGGHPLYLEQCLRFVVDSGAVRLRESGAELVDERGLASLPSSVRASLAARIDALPRPAKDTLLVASVSADAVDPAVLSRVAGDIDVDGGLATLQSAGLLVAGADGRYRFPHRLVQEAAYAGLTRAARSALHLSYLELLDDPALAERAFHAEAAWSAASPIGDRVRLAQRVVRELRLLAESVATWQAAGAAAIYERAAGAVSELEGTGSPEAALLLAGHAHALVETGRLAEARSLAERSVALASEVEGDQQLAVGAETRLALGLVLARLAETAAAREQLTIASDLARDLGDRRLLGRSTWRMADTWRYESESRFRELLVEAHQHLVAAGDTSGQVQVARLLAYLLSMSGGRDFDHWLGEASRLQSLDDLRGRASLARVASFVAAGRADWQAARDHAVEALELGKAAGLSDVVTDALLVAVEANTFVGELALALDSRAQLLERAEMPPRARQALACEGALALLRSQQGAAAVAELALAATLTKRLGDSERLAERQAVAEVSLDSGHWAAAERAAAEATALADAAGMRLLSLQLRLLACRAALAAGERRTTELRDLRALAEELGAFPLVALAGALEDQDALADGRTEQSVPLPDHELVEARATWHENAALRAAAAGDEVSAAASWRAAYDTWSMIGRTVWRERASLASRRPPRDLKELARLAPAT